MMSNSSGNRAALSIRRCLRSSCSEVTESRAFLRVSNSAPPGKDDANTLARGGRRRPPPSGRPPRPLARGGRRRPRWRTMAAVFLRVRAFLSRLAPRLAAVDDYASRWIPILILSLWPLAYGLAAGAAAFAWTHPGWAIALEQNK